MAESAPTATPDSGSLRPEEQPGPADTACYKFLWPVLPYTRKIISSSVASELLDLFLTEPGSSLFGGASPYILTTVFRKKSVLHPTSPRQTSPALLAAILWARVVDGLYKLTTSLVSERDPGRWRRTHGGLREESDLTSPNDIAPKAYPDTTPANEPAGDIDDVLTYILLSIAISGSHFKSDCSKWWSKAVRLAITLRLNREDGRCSATIVPCVNPVCSCQRRPMEASALDTERKEERRRVFWLLYSLDRHLSLSFNEVLSIPDSYCEVYAPLPELIWENLDAVTPSEMPAQVSPSVEAIQNLLDSYELSVDVVMHCPGVITSRTPTRMHRCSPIGSSAHAEEVCAQPASTSDQSRARLAIVYSTHILHGLHVLLYGKWDAIAMLEDDDGWITSKRFTQCTSHAIAASQSLSTILAIDPELAFMSYLFGIYLLQGSFIFLLFADRLPQLGPNESVQQACENIIRAHEVCVVTLSTEFQV
ncbi:beta-glucosidase [Purpureocillium lavendulum]|uniref:Beta-glucosidase n=1 Tax=Purpureocillium lavendulum TaxID=1247861 RepID=A0AB34FEK2_9HYPO|nr:beta-glucosidase [Purpureocillium lavendulum]